MAKAEQLWTCDQVADRFEDAAATARRLPPVKVQGYFNCWPALARSEWEAYSAEEAPRVRFPPTPHDIERMLETMRWVLWLEVEQRHLVWMRAKRYGWREIGVRFACCTRTAQRHWQMSIFTVVEQLNGKGSSTI
jgi:hypothetical protein